MEVEPVSCIKQRGNRSTIPPPVTDDREDENDEVPITQDEEAPKPGLLWRAGSGLWGITSVGSYNKICLLKSFYLLVIIYPKIKTVVGGTAGLAGSAVKTVGGVAAGGVGAVASTGWSATKAVGTIAAGAVGATTGAVVGAACKVPGVERVGERIFLQSRFLKLLLMFHTKMIIFFFRI